MSYIRPMKQFLHRFRSWLWSLRRFVVLDPADNSVTLSRLLFRDMQRRADGGAARVFVFGVSAEHSFGFMLGAPREEPTQLCDIQYNDRYRCVGFETLCPSVGRMLYTWKLPPTTRCKLSVALRSLPDGRAYYLILPPKRRKK